jgi:ABC-type lipoprotein release transport system permease subunit
VTFVVVPLLVVVVASLASLLPALRATRVDPARALRSD